MQLLDLLQEGINIQEHIPLSRFTFTKTGGPAEFIAFPRTIEQIKRLIEVTKENEIPLTVLGNASNLIIRDGGIKGLVILLNQMNQIIALSDHRIKAYAGARIINTSEAAYRQSLSGLEFAAGIPGSVGGAVYMNAGAYDGEIKDVLESVTVLTRDDELKTYTNEEMNFSYRHSLVQENGAVVLFAIFKLKPAKSEPIRTKMDHLNALRRAKQPLEYPSCGSVFKRPAGHYTGPLIIEAGLQGKQIGGAQVSMKHAGFIVNVDHATATDYVNLIHLIQTTIKEKYDINLETEVRIIGQEI
ncbi:UDP-N-acetylenolpyruvoylglucosamine reductase [Amylolactobacillus amylotrophicus DSM 20534]|uniref:UDP-N-acetylenolpyruvoylglucosamine reductase n=3 Tax=Amylolactobacillus TaxID=2767876 RepID=A0A1L6XDE0_9LACO|nr:MULTISPECIES: UDP-N-acetylmuramate dehydrogenase [Amylolactobacillus]APT18988.1 UDP-N-acetylenolpyruvoylglucosamine reductase [Amylolactobacillus amylophilus DSM 20533 = JCM 1125]KRK38750.1 UDP-N-acetylenolpyruvoylglucosamine reductase [Amylolactobacillus amylotrophicus DSM 20534]KRM42607.1 UDP-N-acetylenolpyruvoylglucosamine reductase [Amylolactobacillus amylophilus DSM 20533 = JCM 1125]GED79970.1 UDP-N-acetylenolpyruvoylglucosamine reductase [Amylolactobacillus amylophilus]